ncbi:MAG: guanylate kinase [Thermodesulfobacteriota bacterium]
MRDTTSGLLFIICAPSGTGKTTLIRKMLAEFHNFKFSLSYTTRSPRSGEKQGREYYFVDQEEFLQLVDKDFFAEWAEVHSNYYGTPYEEISRITDQGVDVLFDIDVQGARQLSKNLNNRVLIFVLPPGRQVLEQRIQGRGTDSQEDIQKRLQKAKEEMQAASDFDYCIVNQDLEQAYDKLRSIYIAEKSKTYYNKKVLEDLLDNW